MKTSLELICLGANGTKEKKATMEINHNDWRISLLHIINQNKIESVRASTFDGQLINFWLSENPTDDLARAECKHY